MNGNFYFQGKMFETQEKMFIYAKQWKSFRLDEQSANKIFDGFKRDILGNVFLRGLEFTNQEFSEYVEEVFEFAMNKLGKKKKKIKGH